MAFPVAAGGANYSGNFIPEIWSSKPSRISTTRLF